MLYTSAFGADQLIRFLGPAPHNKLSAVPVGDQPESVSFARDGSFYVGHHLQRRGAAFAPAAGRPQADPRHAVEQLPVPRRHDPVHRLVVKDVPRGSTVTATCRTKNGRRCRGIKKFTKRNARGDVSLMRFLRKTLRAGTVIEVRVTKPGTIGAVKRLTVRRGKNPTIKTSCLPPGAKRPTRC